MKSNEKEEDPSSDKTDQLLITNNTETKRFHAIDQWMNNVVDRLDELCTVDEHKSTHDDIVVEQHIFDDDQRMIQAATKKASSTCVGSSVASSTIPVETIRKRVSIESGRERKKQNRPRIKSRADVIQGDRRNNMSIIKEHSYWNDDEF